MAKKTATKKSGKTNTCKVATKKSGKTSVRKVAQKKSKNSFLQNTNLVSRKVTIGIIIAAMILVALAAFSAIFLNSENMTKYQIENIVSDYYENYYYQKTKESTDDFESRMRKYSTIGFSKITLRQLLLFNNEKYRNISNDIRRYCNVDRTYVQIYPTAPYSNKDYTVKYNYSCNF